MLKCLFFLCVFSVLFALFFSSPRYMDTMFFFVQFGCFVTLNTNEFVLMGPS